MWINECVILMPQVFSCISLSKLKRQRQENFSLYLIHLVGDFDSPPPEDAPTEVTDGELELRSASQRISKFA